MIYYKLFDLFPVFTEKITELNCKNGKAGGAIFFPTDLGIKPTLSADQYRLFFKDLDKNIPEDLENYDIYLVRGSVNESGIKEIIMKILKGRD